MFDNQAEISGLRAKVAKNLLERALGLIAAGKTNLLFVFPSPGIYPIHSFFVPFSFTAVYLDENFRVVDVFRVEPFSAFVCNTKPAKYLLECVEPCKFEVGSYVQCRFGVGNR